MFYIVKEKQDHNDGFLKSIDDIENSLESKPLIQTIQLKNAKKNNVVDSHHRIKQSCDSEVKELKAFET